MSTPAPTSPSPAPSRAPAACPHCGKPVPADAALGLCPACLLAAGAASQTEAKAAAFTPPPLAELAARFPQLELLEVLGRGGMGVVYKARQRALDRLVALKILPRALGDDPAFADRFTREARALAQLNHPGIVTLYEFGRTDDGLFFILMEFVDGVNLRQLLAGGRVAPREALAIVPELCDALQYAHDRGLVHRDIKPENILLDRRGRVKIADFGLAKLVGNDSAFGVPPSGGSEKTESDRLKTELPTTGLRAFELTEAGKIMGTPSYMAPEQTSRPAEVDHRADIYALGVVFYQMLTGELPDKTLSPPSRKVILDVRLDEVVLRALEKEPSRRWQQASAMKTQVETIAATPEVPAPGSAAVLSRQSSAMADPAAPPGVPPGGRGTNGAGGTPTPAGETPTLPETTSHFSRKAIVGACWAPLFFITFMLAFTVHARVPGEEYHAAGWQMLLAFTLLPLGVAAPFGTTILGWVAIGQIRRSAGIICGLGLAVFDGLLFPLLALDVVVLKIVLGAVELVLRPLAQSDAGRLVITARYLYHDAPGLVLIPALIGVAFMDWRIIRRVWRAVNPPPAGATASTTTAAPAPRQRNRVFLAFVFGSMGLGILGMTALTQYWKSHDAPSSSTTADSYPLLRVTLRVLDLPHGLTALSLARPAALFDRGDVRVLASPSVVVPSGAEGVIDIPADAAFATDGTGMAILGKKAHTLFIHPTYENGTRWVHFTLDGLLPSTPAADSQPTRQPMRSGSVELGEFQALEEHGLENGRSQWAVLTIEMEPQPSPASVSASAEIEITKVKLAAARRVLAEMSARFQAGVATSMDVAMAQTEVLVLEAELASDAVGATMARLALAQRQLAWQTAKFQAGQAVTAEVETAKTAVAIAEIKLREARASAARPAAAPPATP